VSTVEIIAVITNHIVIQIVNLTQSVMSRSKRHNEWQQSWNSSENGVSCHRVCHWGL